MTDTEGMNRTIATLNQLRIARENKALLDDLESVREILMADLEQDTPGLVRAVRDWTPMELVTYAVRHYLKIYRADA